jgi:hypothetical protein
MLTDVLSDAAIWGTILLIAVGGVAVASMVVVWVLTASGRLAEASARAAYSRILRVAVAVFVFAFVGAMIVGLFA